MLFLHEKLSLFLVQKTEIVWNKNPKITSAEFVE